jgi:hypothetical protein
MLEKYKIVYSLETKQSIKNFLKYMKEHCIYNNSWLYCEDFLVERFNKDCKQFILDLKEHIRGTVYRWIFGVIEEKNDAYEDTKLVIWLRSYTIVLKCRKWLKEHIFEIKCLQIRS